MNVPLDRKTVRMERLVGTETQQVVVEGSFALPANLPNIDRIVRLTANPVVADFNVFEDEVVVQGTVDFIVVYAHEEEVLRPAAHVSADPVVEATEIEAERGYDVDEEVEQPGFTDVQYREVLYRQKWRRGATFEAVLDVPGSHEEANVEAWAEPLDFDVHLHTNGRGVDVETVIAVGARVTDDEIGQVSVKGKGFPADAEIEEEVVDVEHLFARCTTHLSIEGQLPLSSELPARTVVDLRATVRLDETGRTTGENELSGEATIDYKAVCADHNGDLDVFSWQEQTPFAFSIHVPGISAGMPFEIKAKVTSVDGAVTSGGHELEVFVDVQLIGRIFQDESLHLVTSVTGSDEKEIRSRTDLLRLDRSFGKHFRGQNLTAQLDLPQGYPPIERVLDSTARLHADDVLVLGDKVLVEGQVDVDALYVARTEGNPVYYVHWARAVPVELEVPVAGAEPGMDAEVSIDVTNIDMDLLNRETVEIALEAVARARVSQPVEYDVVVEAVEVPPLETDPPTLTFVVVQADDTLWKLSHRYYANIDEIVQANAWLTDPDAPLPVGRKLCIPRRRPTPAPTTPTG